MIQIYFVIIFLQILVTTNLGVFRDFKYIYVCNKYFVTCGFYEVRFFFSFDNKCSLLKKKHAIIMLMSFIFPLKYIFTRIM